MVENDYKEELRELEDDMRSVAQKTLYLQTRYQRAANIILAIAVFLISTSIILLASTWYLYEEKVINSVVAMISVALTAVPLSLGGQKLLTFYRYTQLPRQTAAVLDKAEKYRAMLEDKISGED